MSIFRKISNGLEMQGCNLYHYLLTEKGYCCEKGWNWEDLSTQQVMQGRQWLAYWEEHGNPCSDQNVPINVVPPTIEALSEIEIGVKLELLDYGTWISDTGIIGYELQWYRNSVAIIGETDIYYTITIDDVDTFITCHVVAIDSDGASLPANSNSILISTVAINSALPNVTGVLIVGQVLTTDNGTWSAIGAITYSYQWKRGGVNIGGATSSTYTLVQADAGENITCQVTATTLAGTANATSAGLAIFDTILDSMPSPLVGVSSVRLLRGAHYGNPIIRVRRSGDNAEADFGVTTSGVLNTASVVAFCIAGGGTQNGFIRTVYGQSGAGINKVQPTPSLQMQIVSGGSLITLNGKVGVQGASGRLMEFGTTSTFNALHNGTTSFIHYVGSLKSASEGIVSNNGGSTAQIGTYVGSNTSNRITISVTNGTAGQPPISVNSSNNVFTANNQIILGIQLDADNATASNRVNAFINAGANILTNTNTFAPSASNASNVMQLPTTGFTGIEQEIIIWGVDMSANRTTLRNKTNSFYGTY